MVRLISAAALCSTDRRHFIPLFISWVSASVAQKSDEFPMLHKLASAFREEHGGLPGLGSNSVKVTTEADNTVEYDNAVEATNIPLQKLSIIAQLSYHRTYCIAIRVPKGTVEDCFIYDSAEEYKYIRLTACDERTTT